MSMVFKYDTIKKNAKAIFITVSGGRYCESGIGSTQFLALYASLSGKQKPKEILNEWIDEGIKLIDNWDIRMVRKLIELFPGCIPQAYHKRAPLLDMNEDGDWCLVYE